MKFVHLLLALLTCLLALSSCALYEDADAPAVPYDYDLSEYITLGTYKGITLTRAQITPTEGDVQAQVDSDFSALTSLSETPVKEGDTVSVSYTAVFEETTYGDDTEDGFFLKIGENALGIPGFDEGLIGACAGDTVPLALRFPDDYAHNPDYAGKDVSFHVTINYIRLFADEITDEQAASVSVYETAAEYLDGVRESLTQVKRVQLAWEQLVKESTVKTYPTREYETYYEDYYASYTKLAEGYGMTLDELIASSGMTKNEFAKEAKTVCEKYIKEDLLVYAIARAEGLSVSETDYIDRRANYFAAVGSQYFPSEAQMEESIGREVLTEQFLSSIVLDFISEHTVITD